MPLPKAPTLCTFPLMGTEGTLFGTGFLVSDGSLCLTAGHVVDAFVADGQLVEAVFFVPDDGLASVAVGPWFRSSQYDIAVGKVSSFERGEALTLATADPPLNADVLCMEFSRVSPRVSEGRRELVMTPSSHKGHVVARYTSDFPEAIPTESLDVSFPALRGASGAALISEFTGDVVGMIVANHERHLMPAHVERVDVDGDVTEEIKYFLPLGKAISWRHLQEVLEEALPVLA
jgi:hypothetical protein